MNATQLKLGLRHPKNQLVVELGDGNHGIWCPACDRHHPLRLVDLRDIGSKATGAILGEFGWTVLKWEPLTLATSIKSYAGENRKELCHLAIRNGNLVYLSDSTHKLAGEKIPMVDWPGFV